MVLGFSRNLRLQALWAAARYSSARWQWSRTESPSRGLSHTWQASKSSCVILITFGSTSTPLILFSSSCSGSKKSRKENPQKLTQLSSRFHQRHLVGNRTAQKDTIIDITSDSQVNSNFPYRWSPASLTFNNYFYLYLY